MNNIKEEKKESLNTVKIITLGETGVGKTSILKRYVYNSFEEDTISTIGLNFGIKEIILKDNTKIKLSLIDTAGQERYRSLSTTYFKNADAVLYVFSLDKKGSYEKIKEWKKMFKQMKKDEGVPAFLIRNKCDLDELNINEVDNFNEENINDFLEENNFLKYITTSAKDNTNIDKVFQEISETWYNNPSNKNSKNNIKILKNHKEDQKKQEKKVKKRNCVLCTGDV